MIAYYILFCSWQTHLDDMLIYSILKALSYITTKLTKIKYIHIPTEQFAIIFAEDWKNY